MDIDGEGDVETYYRRKVNSILSLCPSIYSAQKMEKKHWTC